MNIEHDLLPKQRRHRQGLKVSVDLFPLATELYEELDRIGIIDRLKAVKQLGLLEVPKKLEKTRYDYVVLQMYFHEIIRKNIQSSLQFTYSNRIRLTDFPEDHDLDETVINKDDQITLADIIQLLIVAYNIGHFYNTFVASRAIVMLASREPTFHEHIQNSSKDERYRTAADSALKSHNYQRIHLLNTLLVLERCDQNKRSVRIAKELVLAYLIESKLPEKNKLRYAFNLFRSVRTVAYVAYDLQIAGVPFAIDLLNEEGLLAFFDEYLAYFNNSEAASNLILAMVRMLSSSVYNELSSVIQTTRISKHMIDGLCVGNDWLDYYEEYWLSSGSQLNIRHSQRFDYESPYLKLTFLPPDRNLTEQLYEDLDRQENTRVGFYLRHTGEMTVVSAVKKSCVNKTGVSFRTLRKTVSYIRMMRLAADDPHYILAVKYFLYYLFNSHQTFIRPVLDEKKCVICTKGKNARITELKKLLVGGTPDERHEAEAMISFLEADELGDITLTVSGSTVVYQDGKMLCEFDGIIIYPNREAEQVVLIEAKNTYEKPSYGKKCLIGKLKKLGMSFTSSDVVVSGHDAYLKLSI